LVLDNADGPSSLMASLSTAVELFEGRINAAVANGVRWGTWSVLVAALSHFPELKSELELFRTRVRAASDSLASHVPPSVARSPPDGVG
jgi:hypothetical protein